ncbi:hypothetical protein MASR2M52_01990 [Pedobacter sp.]
MGSLAYVNDGVNTSSNNNLHPQTGAIEASFKTADLTSLTISRGPGMDYTNNSSYSYVGILPDGQDENAAVANGVYFQIAVNSATKYLSLTRLNARLRTANEVGSATAAVSANITYRWHYSTDGTNFTALGAPVLLGNTVTAGVEQPLIDLSVITALKDLQPNTTVYFRIYAWGATGGTTTNRGFGFGKSTSSGLEILSLRGFLAEAPVMAAWDFTGINGTTSTTVNTVFQKSWVKKTDVVNTLAVAKGAGLEAGSLSNAYAVTYIDALAPSAFPTNYSEAITNNTFYAIQLRGQNTDYTQILGYKVKFRGNLTTATTARWKLLIGDSNNDISASSQVLDLGTDISLVSNSDGVYYSLGLSNNDVSAVIPPNKNAELRLYVWGGTSETGVFGLGRVADETHLMIYGKTMTPAEYLQVLPITLTSFKASKQSNSVRLNWATTNEKDNSHFNIWRAGADKNFVNIGKVNGSGTTETAKTYSLTDYKPLAGANYYKLSQTDLNGQQVEVGGVQIVQFDLNNTSLTVVQQANPSTVKAILNANKTDKATVAIYNVSGNTVYKNAINLSSGVNEVAAPVSLGKGVYILKVKTQSGDAWQAKFVK